MSTATFPSLRQHQRATSIRILLEEWAREQRLRHRAPDSILMTSRPSEFTLGRHRREVPEARSDPPGRAAGPARQVHRRGLHRGLARQPVPGVLGRVLRASQVHRRRQHLGRRLERLRQDRPLLHQEVPGRDQPDGLPRDGPLRVDGLHLSPGADQVRVQHQPGGRPLLPDDPPARPGRPDRLRPEGPPEPGAGEQAVATRQHPLAAGQAEAGGRRRTSRPACTRSPA